MRGGSGALVILLYALYGAFVSSLYIQFGDKGSVRSADFVLFLIVIVLLAAGNLGSLLVHKTAAPRQRRVLLVLFLYLAFRAVASESSPQLHVGILVTEIGLSFLVGFIAFSELRLRLPLLWRMLAPEQGFFRARRIAVVATAAYVASNAFLLAQFAGGSVLDLSLILDISPLSNDYYQDYGDFMIIAHCCLVSLQLTYIRLAGPSRSRFLVFLFVLLGQAAIAFLSLQAVNSNKSVVAIVLVTVVGIYVGKARGWPTSSRVFSLETALGTALVLLAVSAAYARYVPDVDLSRLRIFDYGESSSLLQNSSLVVRWEQLVGEGIAQLQRAPVFGDVTLKTYVHSTLISLQTHLGLVGSLLFWTFVAMKLRDIAQAPNADSLKIIALPILFVAIISSFFAWGPLWFLIGSLYAYIPDVRGARRPGSPAAMAQLPV